ncbi:MAG: LamG domain-containing protein [Planctomycetes bacterium]|nr:LamG domain-containing protein [Planctomycetota bacterium]
MPKEGLVLHLTAEKGVETGRDGKVQRWIDQSDSQNSAAQTDPSKAPRIVKSKLHDVAALRFNGQSDFLTLKGQLLRSQDFAIFAVVSDLSTSTGHREIFSNWNGAAGNSATSLFLGMTGVDSARLSDDFSGVGQIARRDQPFLLAGINGSNGARVRQNGTDLAVKGSRLSSRNLSTEYVIGQQGNIGGEYWNGDLFELLVYDRDLTERDIHSIEQFLIRKYQLPNSITKPKQRDSEFLTLASLCHVLLNTNEFAYVD